jgi:glyoxylate reductase
MARPRVFVTRRLPGGALGFLAQHASVTVRDDEMPPSRDELLRGARGCDGLLTLLTDCVDAALLDAAPEVLVVSNMATGFDNVDVAAASARNVLVTRTPGVLSETTAEFTFALMLAAARRVVEGDRLVRRGLWKTWGPEVLLGHDVRGATLGIVGMGGIGAVMARLAGAFGMRVVYYSRTRKPDLEKRYRMAFLSLDALLRESDFVSLHAPLTPETERMIGARELRLMKGTAVLVNTARGRLVDPQALRHALAEGWIAAAAVDVTDPEPMPADDPLLALENLVVTPHIASASVATRSRMAMLAAENLVQGLAGHMPTHTVNREIAAAWRARVRERLRGDS